MASNPKTVTRASTRAKTATSQPATGASRTTRGASAARLKEPTSSREGFSESRIRSVSRKPFVSRDNSPEVKPVAEKRLKATTSKSASLIDVDDDIDREPIKAFLRIRPHLSEGEPSSTPYLEPISDTAVRMLDPSSSSYSRLSAVNPSSIYTFSHIFPPSTQQSDFFSKTTLPLVKDVLEGQSALLFAYGVTNSGKTYSIQGGNTEGSAGILPRTLDVIFNSIEGLHGDGRYRPVRLQGIELAGDEPSAANHPSQRVGSSKPALADILEDDSPIQSETDPTTLKLDRNYEYTIWLSYAEVYNEKVYDLFASVDDSSSTDQTVLPSHSQTSGIPRPMSSFLNLTLPSAQSHPLLLTRKALSVKPCPPSDTDSASTDISTSGKYVAGLRQLRVHDAAQAKELLKLGQLHRRVFGTLANSQSSRSHALVTIKILRVHRGEKNDPTSIQTSRLTLVDLAGSERTKHTHTSGERLREAGNINKSLMVLGQCMETMRANQRALARSLGGGVGSGTRLDTRDVKKGLAVVPFRHSKLTETLMDYFVGEGRAVMIVNVNPYDTGYDENSHVMKFAALAREVCTVAPTAIPRSLPVQSKNKSNVRNSEVAPHRRKVTITMGGSGRKASETHLEVLEEDEEPEEGGSDHEDNDEPINPLVDALFDEIESLRMQLFDSEMRCAVIEATTREEVMLEMEERMRHMEKMYTRRLMKEVEQSEMRMDAKIDMLHRAGALNKTTGNLSESSDELDDIEEEDEIESSLKDDVSDDAGGTQETEPWISDISRSPSPLAGRSKGNKATGSMRRSESSAYSDDIEEDELDIDSAETGAPSTEDDELHSEIESWTPPQKRPVAQPKSKAKFSKTRPEHLAEPPSPIFEEDVKPTRKKASTGPRGTQSIPSGVDKLTQHLDELSLEGNTRDSTVIIPNRKARQDAVAHGGRNVEYVPQDGEVDVVKKKKRQLGKRSNQKHDIVDDDSDGRRQLRSSFRGAK